MNSWTARQDPTPSAWVEAFVLCLISSVFKEPRLAGVMLRVDHAPELRNEEAEPAALAEMDALCCYLVEGTASEMHDAPALHKPDAEERNRAARQLDEAGPLSDIGERGVTDVRATPPGTNPGCSDPNPPGGVGGGAPHIAGHGGSSPQKTPRATAKPPKGDEHHGPTRGPNRLLEHE